MRQRLRLGGIALVLAGLAVILGIGVGALMLRAMYVADQEDALRHELIAERVFDEMEGELTELIEREEARSFLEYRYVYAPPGQVAGNVALVRSPLSRAPDEPYIEGYFQIDPDGTVHSPRVPRDNERTVAGDAEPADTAYLARVERVDFGAPTRRVTPQRQEYREKQVAQQKTSSYGASTKPSYSMNRNVGSRSTRGVQSISTSSWNLEPFQNDQVDVQEVTKTKVLVPVDDDADLAAEVERNEVIVTPIEGRLVDDGTLVLSRRVRIGGDTWRQGLVLDVSALATHLEQDVLGSSALDPWIALSWGAEAPPARTWEFTHAFAPPFEAMAVTAAVAPIPGETRGGRLALLMLAAMLAGAYLIGAFAVWRMVTAEVDFARRRHDFVAAVSHELKTPLTAIRMYGEMLRDGMVPSDERRQTYYGTITAESERLSRLIDNVLELGRLERGTGSGEIVVGRIEPILQRVPEVLGPHARDQGFTLEVEADDDLPSVRVDPDALLQVLLNLVDNAVKFSSSSDDKRVTLRAERQGSGVRLVVRDRGPGVPPRQLARVFEPFHRGERELTRTTKGTGIGLALVKGLVERMGGALRARNHPDGGFEVAIRLVCA